MSFGAKNGNILGTKILLLDFRVKIQSEVLARKFKYLQNSHQKSTCDRGNFWRENSNILEFSN